MDLHERQQFDLLLELAVARYVERLEQRNEGAENALNRLRDDPEGENIWLSQFVDAIFQDFLLNTPDGSAFVLRALAKRRVSWSPAAFTGTVDALMQTTAMRIFGELLRQKSDEELERRIGYLSVTTAQLR
jgi:hypothetical protein